MNWETVILATIAAVPPTLVAFAAYRKSEQTHQAVNSRMTELLELTRIAAGDKATLAEKEVQSVKDAAKL